MNFFRKGFSEKKKVEESEEAILIKNNERMQYASPKGKWRVGIFFIIMSTILIAVFLYFSIISIGIVWYSKEYLSMGIVGLAVSVSIIFLNVNFIRIAIVLWFRGHSDRKGGCAYETPSH